MKNLVYKILNNNINEITTSLYPGTVISCILDDYSEDIKEYLKMVTIALQWCVNNNISINIKNL